MAKLPFQLSLLPSEEKIKTLSRPEKITYLNRWLMKARMIMYAPGLLLIGLSVVGAIIIRYIPYTPMFGYFAMISLVTPLLLYALVFGLTKSRLLRCVHRITEETWTDRTDVPLLLEILDQVLPIPYTLQWAREQLAHAVLLHSQELTGREKMGCVRIFFYYLHRFTSSSKEATGYYRQIVQGLPLICEALAEIGGRNEAALLKSVLKKALASHCSAELCEAVENSLARLEARLIREEAPDMLLRAGQMPDDGLLRAASNPQASTPDSLLRAAHKASGD